MTRHAPSEFHERMAGRTQHTSYVIRSLFLFLFSLVLMAQVGCSTGPQYRSRIFVQGERWRGVEYLCAGPDGAVYFTGPFASRVYSILPDDPVPRSVADNPPGPISAFTVSPDRAFWGYVAQKHQLVRWGGGAGVQLIGAGIPPSVGQVVFNSEGRLFVTGLNGSVSLYELSPRDGRLLFRVSEALGRAALLAPSDDGSLYAALPQYRHLVGINVDTGEIHSLRSIIPEIHSLAQGPRGILWASAGDVGNPRLLRIDVRTGQSSELQAPDIFHAMAFAGGKLFCVNVPRNVLFEIAPESGGWKPLLLSPLTTPCGLYYFHHDSADALYAADVTAIREFDPQSGRLRRQFEPTLTDGRRAYPFFITVNLQHVVASSWMTNSVHVIDRSSGKTVWSLEGLSAPQAALELNNGDVVVAEMGADRIIRVAPAGPENRQVIAIDLRGPCALVPAPDGGLYVTEHFGGRVAWVDLHTLDYRIILDGLLFPEGLALAHDGQLLVTEVGRRRLLRVHPLTGRFVTIAGDLAFGLKAPSGYPPSWFPTGVAEGPDGDIYLSSDVENAILRLSAAQ